MKKRFIIVYTVFAALFMLISLSFMGFNLYKEYKQGNSRSASIFANTVFRLYTDLADLDESKSNYYKKLAASAGDLNDFSFFEIKQNGKTIFLFPSGSSKENSSSKFTKNYETTIKINNEKSFYVNCNIFTLRPYSIFYYSRFTFYLILGITILTIILIIVSNRNQKQRVTIETVEKSDENMQEQEKDSGNTTIDNENETNNEKIEIEQIEVKYDRPSEDNDFEYDDNLESTTTLQEEKFSVIDDNNKDIIKEPEGLFSTTTGLGWESYLLTRLENEINRAISTEMDLSLFIIKLTKLDRKSDLCKKICDYLAEQFQFRDLLFEYKDDCIVAIETGANLDEALILGEKIHNDISKYFENTDSKCYIGISTRSVRMISSEHFLKEADEALLHAQDDENCPIIAFKADIEKYRKYLEQKFDD